VALAAAVAGPLLLAWEERRARVRIGQEKAAAQASLGAALESIDRMLLRVGDSTLADVPQMEQVRASLLEDAQALLAGLAARGAGDPAVLRLSAHAQWRAGALAALLGRKDDAEESFRAAEELFESLPGAARELALVRLDLGDMLVADPERAADARAALDAGREGLLALPEDGETLQDLSQAWAGLGSLEAQLGHAEEAAEAYEQAVDNARRARDAAPGESEPRVLLATALSQLGNVRASTGRDEDARAPLEESVELLSGLSEEQPEVADWRLRLGLCRGSLGHLLFAAQLDEEARVQVVAARDVFAGLVGDFPRVPRYRLELAGMLQAQGALAGDGPQSEALNREALTLIEGVAAESPAEIDLLANLSAGYANLALTLALQERWAEARDAVGKSSDARRRMTAVNPGHPAAAPLLGHELRTVEMLLDAEPDEATRTLARDLAREALEAKLRDAADLAGDPRWAGVLEPPAGAGEGGAP
jgi:tetratricopeptide (TPR) repeat protein